MERLWLFERLAVSVATIDFLDPALSTGGDVRERGVRIEVRRVGPLPAGSIYASPALSLSPAIVRVDLLESAPGAADRMHWHPAMCEGEPGERTVDPTISDDLARWLRTFLSKLGQAIGTRDVAPTDDLSHDLAAITDAAEEIVDHAMDSLAQMRQPWPAVQHDHRGLARAGQPRSSAKNQAMTSAPGSVTPRAASPM